MPAGSDGWIEPLLSHSAAQTNGTLTFDFQECHALGQMSITRAGRSGRESIRGGEAEGGYAIATLRGWCGPRIPPPPRSALAWRRKQLRRDRPHKQAASCGSMPTTQICTRWHGKETRVYSSVHGVVRAMLGVLGAAVDFLCILFSAGLKYMGTHTFPFPSIVVT